MKSEKEYTNVKELFIGKMELRTPDTYLQGLEKEPDDSDVHDEKTYIREIIECTCKEKMGDLYEIDITMDNKEAKYVWCSENPGYIQNFQGTAKLWLSDNSRMHVNRAVDRFKMCVKEALDGYIKVSVIEDLITVHYRHLGKGRFDFLIDNKKEKWVDGNPRKIELFEDSSLGGLLHELDCLCSLDRNSSVGENNPLYLSAVEHGDEVMKSLIKLHYNFDDDSDCELLSKEVYGSYVLPRLPKEYDKFYFVDRESITKIPIGYEILHKAWFCMHGNTHQIYQLNPHTRQGVDAASANNEVITFEEYLDLFRQNGYEV